MDFQEREQLVRRINTSKLYGTINFLNEEYEVVISDPTNHILCQADWIYKKKYKNYKEAGGLTLEESFEILRTDGVWDNELELEVVTKTNLVNELKKKLSGLKFLKIQLRAAKEAIEGCGKRIEKLLEIKNSLWQHTIEHTCLVEKRRFIMSKITEGVDPIEFTNSALLKNINFLSLLSVYYYEESAISAKQIRELARTDPWRLYWTVSKETGTSLFPHSSVEMTEMQYALVIWSRIYDFAYESQNRPSDIIINDDDLFDSWYESECQSIKSRIEESNGGGGLSGSETFIMADQEGAREVYDLNNKIVRENIKQREKVIMEKGQVLEAELPDVKNNIKMMANQLASQGIQNRTKR